MMIEVEADDERAMLRQRSEAYLTGKSELMVDDCSAGVAGCVASGE